ncbi:MAG: DUF5333 domain-containing protein [Rubellimicrobium sp.]|nr:DUF5333 domain-containing protein [Rubellimicrobium sp.]
MLARYPIRSLALVLGFTVIAGTTVANQSLGQVTRVTEGLINTAIAYEVSRVCPSIHPRMVDGLIFLNSLKAHAQSLGFSEAEIDAYTRNRAEKARLEAIARGRLAEMGAVVGEPQTYCEVGRAEMAAGSQIGRLLR